MKLETLFVLSLALGAAAACSRALPGVDPRLDPPGELPAPPPSVTAAARETPCTGEGDEPGVDGGSGCCDGLLRVPVYKGSLLRLDDCVQEGKGRSLCLRCGDGDCGRGENVCNCPSDCR